jgi:hypothetical protein
MKITKLLILSAFVFSLAACGPTGSGGSGYGDLVIEDYNPDKPVNGDQFDFDDSFDDDFRLYDYKAWDNVEEPYDSF